MQLGAFSISLAVKDIHASKAFYEKLGFTDKGGNIEHGWLVLQNGTTNIGLFQGMFEDNILTFNPGWDQNAQPLDSFTDVRDLKAKLKADGLEILQEQQVNPDDPNSPASFAVLDPDGNPILIDQHVPKLTT
ncbi:MAG: VOC family protein [Phycisphaerales bacterium JB043]